MKLICRQCGNTNKFTTQQIVNREGFKCGHCGVYMEKSRFLIIFQTCLIPILSVAGYLMWNSPYISDYLFSDISSKWIQFLLFLFIVLAVVFFVFSPIVAFLMCFITNRVTLMKQKKEREEKR